jgi:5,6-dimethylbenzimidazole synthase
MAAEDERFHDSTQAWLHPAASADVPAALPADTRAALYELMALRRDIRHFDPARSVDEDVLQRILTAAHLAPSVGFSQAWHFVIVRDRVRRARIHENFLRCRERESERFSSARRAQYLSYKLEGILDSALNLCVTVDLRPPNEAVLGTTVQPESIRASVCCAIQNLWLAARAEGIGVGWVSIVEPELLRAEFGLPEGIEPVAYLCVGHPLSFRRRPMLEETGWKARRSLSEVVHNECWSEPASREPH